MISDSIAKKVFYVLLTLVGVVLGVCLITYLVGAHNIVSQPFQVDYGEGFHWGQSWGIFNGQPLYPAASVPSIPCYTPLFFFVSGLFMKLFGSALAVGRTVSLVSFLIASVFIGLIVYQVSKSKIGAIISGLVVFTVPIVRYWTYLNRVDMLAIMFTMAGLYVALKYIDSKKILWSTILFAAAFMSKQSYFIAPAVVSLYLLVKTRKLFFYFTSTYVTLVAVGLGIGNIVSHGGLLLDVWTRDQVDPVSVSTGWAIFKSTLSYTYILLALAVIYVVLQFKKKKAFSPVVIYWLISIPYGIMLSSRAGAFENSMLEATLATCILSGLVVVELASSINQKNRLFALVVLLMVVSQGLLYALGVYNYPKGTAEAYATIESYVKANPGPAISENATFLLNEGKPLLWEPSMIVDIPLVTTKGKAGWDQTQFVSELNTGYFKLIILDYDIDAYWQPGTWSNEMAHQRLTDQMATAIKDHYTLVYHSGPTSQVPQGESIYVPNK